MNPWVLQTLLLRLVFTLALATLASCQAVLGIEDVSMRADAGGDVADSDVPDVQVSRVCPSVFTEEHGDHRYFVSPDRRSYDEAVAACFTMGGHLVVIEDAGENDFVSGLLTDYVWIGQDDLIVENRFEWLTGVQPPYTNWNDNEPNNAGGDEDCGGMYHPGSGMVGAWNDSGCGDQYTFVCECDPALQPRTVPSCVSDLAYDWILNGRRYRWTGTAATWQGARELCQADGAELVVISDVDEQGRIAAMISGTIWLGLRDPEEDGIGLFQWVIGDAIYFNWAPGQPDNYAGIEHHAVMNGGDKLWHDRPSDDMHNVLCECDPESPATNY